MGKPPASQQHMPTLFVHESTEHYKFKIHSKKYFLEQSQSSIFVTFGAENGLTAPSMFVLEVMSNALRTSLIETDTKMIWTQRKPAIPY